MNCSQANQINIVDFLAKSGIVPIKTRGRNFWYNSPLRNEKTPSFKVDLMRNAWFDFGVGYGGHLIDLVCKMYNVDLTGSMRILAGLDIRSQPISFDKQKERSLESPIQIKDVQQLQHWALIKYLEERKIPVNIASSYTAQANYTITNPDTGEVKKYFALAFKNDLSGYELRNKYFKGGTSPKTITTIPGNEKKVNIFEGFIDFLSALVYYRQYSPSNTTIVLNSLSNINRLYGLLPNFDQINLFLDNDSAGENASNIINSMFPVTVNYAQTLYPEHKDFNDLLTAK
jgi:hypothetical protein